MRALVLPFLLLLASPAALCPSWVVAAEAPPWRDAAAARSARLARTLAETPAPAAAECAAA
jgi:hypothetical protein